MFLFEKKRGGMDEFNSQRNRFFYLGMLEKSVKYLTFPFSQTKVLWECFLENSHKKPSFKLNPHSLNLGWNSHSQKLVIIFLLNRGQDVKRVRLAEKNLRHHL